MEGDNRDINRPIRYLNSEWVVYLDDEGDEYFYNLRTEEAVWEDPIADRSADASQIESTNTHDIVARECDLKDSASKNPVSASSRHGDSGDDGSGNDDDDCGGGGGDDDSDADGKMVPSAADDADKGSSSDCQPIRYLDEEWVVYMDEDGDEYYYNLLTEEASWEHPYQLESGQVDTEVKDSPTVNDVVEGKIAAAVGNTKNKGELRVEGTSGDLPIEPTSPQPGLRSQAAAKLEAAAASASASAATEEGEGPLQHHHDGANSKKESGGSRSSAGCDQSEIDAVVGRVGSGKEGVDSEHSDAALADELDGLDIEVGTDTTAADECADDAALAVLLDAELNGIDIDSDYGKDREMEDSSHGSHFAVGTRAGDVKTKVQGKQSAGPSSPTPAPTPSHLVLEKPASKITGVDEASPSIVPAPRGKPSARGKPPVAIAVGAGAGAGVGAAGAKPRIASSAGNPFDEKEDDDNAACGNPFADDSTGAGAGAGAVRKGHRSNNPFADDEDVTGAPAAGNPFATEDKTGESRGNPFGSGGGSTVRGYPSGNCKSLLQAAKSMRIAGSAGIAGNATSFVAVSASRKQPPPPPSHLNKQQHRLQQGMRTAAPMYSLPPKKPHIEVNKPRELLGQPLEAADEGCTVLTKRLMRVGISKRAAINALQKEPGNFLKALLFVHTQIHDCWAQNPSRRSGIWSQRISARIKSWLPNMPSADKTDYYTAYQVVVAYYKVSGGTDMQQWQFDARFSHLKDLKKVVGKYTPSRYKFTAAFPAQQSVKMLFAGVTDAVRDARKRELNAWLQELLASELLMTIPQIQDAVFNVLQVEARVVE